MGLIWIGNEKGVEGLPGIPGRDLSAEEVKQYGGEAHLLATGLYRKEQKMRLGGSENKLAEIQELPPLEEEGN